MQDFVELKLNKIKEINRYLNEWLSEQEFDCTVEFDSDFSYDMTNEIIHYSFVVCNLHDKLFAEVCKNCNSAIENVDNFILSFFHELGHHNTIYIFSAEEWDKYDNQKLKLEEKLKDNLDEQTERKLYNKYYTNPIELEATQWGCDYIVSHSDEVKKFFEGFQKLYKEFLVENNFDISCET